MLMARLSKSPLIFFQLVMQATRDYGITGVIEACLLFRFDPLPPCQFYVEKIFRNAIFMSGALAVSRVCQNSFSIFLKERTDERTLRCFSCRLFVHSPRLSAVRT